MSPEKSHRSRGQILASRPLFWAAVSFSSGILLGRYAWRPPTWWILAALAFAAAAAFFLNRRRYLSFVLVLASFVCVGALAIQTHPPAGSRNQPYSQEKGEAVTVIGHVINAGLTQRDSPSELRQKVDVETESVQSDSETKNVRTIVRLNIYFNLADKNFVENPTSIAQFRYGQRIRFNAPLVFPHNYRNPGAFDYVEYLREKGIFASASSKYASIETLSGFSGDRFHSCIAAIRRSVIERVHTLWPDQIAGLLDAIVIGEESFIDRSTRVDFQRSGTYHVLVVSGMNVSILAMFTLWALKRLRIGEVLASGCAAALILLYALLTNVGPPVWRAALMFLVYLATRLLYRERAVLNALGAAALALLLIDPQSLFGASFQMTFLCIVLVAGIGVPIIERTIEPLARGLNNLKAVAYDRALPPSVAQFRLDLRAVCSRLARIWGKRLSEFLLVGGLRIGFRAAELIFMSAIMQIGLALPMAYYFHRMTSVATPANLFIIPFLQVLMPAAVAAIATSYVSMWAAKIPAAIAAFAVEGIAGTVKWLGGLRVADVRVPTPELSAVLLTTTAIFFALFLIRMRAKLALAGIGIIATSAIWVWAVHPREQLRGGSLELTAIDVGQGDSILLVSPDGHKLLVDAGGLPFWTHSQLDIGEDVVSPYLWARGISQLDAIVLTHAHADHMGGMPAVIANFRPREMWLPEGIASDEIERLLIEARRFNTKVVFHKAGDEFDYGNALVRILAPSPDFPVRSSHRNDESLVMKVTYKNTSALLEGDAEKGTEKLVSSEEPRADVLKIAHHGSASSTNADLLAAVRPRFAVISVGARNVYHHPRPEVLERLQQANVATYRTDLEGATTFYLDGNGVTVSLPGLH